MSTAESRSDLPFVSVVVPMLDEMGFIEECLHAFGEQDYPRDRFEVLVVDGGSNDGSRAYVEKLEMHQPWIRVIENPRRKAAAAFNRGVESARGDIVCLFSAHGVPDPSYLSASVAVLKDTGAVGVGGQYLHLGLDAVSNAIGAAMVSPFGMASPHRFVMGRADVDTISHPAYLREALLAIGPFDESLERNSDYELNYRLRVRGGRLVFDPSIVSIYRPRGSLSALARQFWWYGRWKVRVLERHPGSLRLRHLVAPVVVLGSACAPIVALTRPGRRAMRLGIFAYAVVLLAATIRAQPRRNGASSAAFAAALPVMHGSWGAGFLVSVLEDKVMKR
jgi:glycosyltransferase involved in cell wall biosynthesis